MFKIFLVLCLLLFSYMIRDPTAPDFVKKVLSVFVIAVWNCGVNAVATNPAKANTMITETMILP